MTTKRSDSTSKRTAKEKPPARTNTTSAKTGTKAVPDEMADTLDKPTLEKTKKKVGFQLNWNRAIHIDTIIDDTLLKTLTPTILKLKQESSDPITIGIDSPGGNIPAMQALLGLL